MIEKDLIRIMDHNFGLMDKFINTTKSDLWKHKLAIDDLQKALAAQIKYNRDLKRAIALLCIVKFLDMYRIHKIEKELCILRQVLGELNGKEDNKMR